LLATPLLESAVQGDLDFSVVGEVTGELVIQLRFVSRHDKQVPDDEDPAADASEQSELLVQAADVTA
jgi:hypothetical protein